MTTARCSNADRVAGQRPAHVRRVQLRPRRPRTPASRPACAASACRGPRRHQPRPAPPRQRPAAPGAARPGSGGRLGRGRGLLEDDVRVGAADPERGHPGPARPPARGPRHRPRSAAAPSPADQSTCGDGSSACSVGGSTPVPHRQHHLDHPGHPGRRLGVPDVRLDRAQPQRPVRRPVLPVGGEQRLRLDRVAQRRCRCRAPPPRPPRPRRSPALASAARITRCCDGPFGAVSPLLRAVLVDRAARAPPPAPGARCGARPTAAPAAARPRPRPSPCRRRAAENALHRPSAASPRCRVNSTNMPGVAITVTPPASARSHSPAAAPGRPGAAPPATTSTPCPPSPPGPPGPSVYETRPGQHAGRVAGQQVALDALGAVQRRAVVR